MAASATQPQPPETLISATSDGGRYWSDLWHFRELFLFLAWRDILVRYKQTAFGVGWALLRPAMTLGVFTLVFRYIVPVPDTGSPYPLVALCALLPWQFFATAVTSASASLLGNAGMITKVYFPRLLIPASSVMVNFLDLLLSALVLGGLMLWYGVMPGIQILLLPLFTLLLLGLTLAVGIWLSALVIRFPDIKHIIPFALQIGLYVSPVVYPSALVPRQWQWLYALNPLVGIMDGFRWVLLGTPMTAPWPVLCSLAWTGALLTSGWTYFIRAEKDFADQI